MIDRQAIEQTVAMLEAQRITLGDVVVEISLSALRKELAEGEQHKTATSVLRGERKQVTVMFADISGFTTMDEKLDPEEVRCMINGCFERLGMVIDRYEGHIDKFIGDGIMALFGMHTTHENDPERALRAALDMMSTLAEFNAEHAGRLTKPLALHFGINSGLVISGGIGTSQRQDYSVMGDPVNLASRLEGLSEAGEILVGENTYRLTAPLFEFEALKPVKVKGKEKPAPLYRLIKAKTVPGQVRGRERLFSPLVGRQNEMSILEKALANAQNGQGSVISIIGESGLGKSRLVAELGLKCKLKGQVNWAEGVAISYGQSDSYLSARHLFCNLLGVAPEALPAEVALALRSEVDSLFLEPAVDIYPFLGHLLGVSLPREAARRVKYLEGEALHRQILQSVRRYISAKAGPQPLILVWEDLQWVDPSSLDLLEALSGLIQQNPLLLILVYRPRRERRIWAFHKKVAAMLGQDFTCIELSPLTIEESKQLLNNLLGVGNASPEIARLVLSKAEGNPFYVAEMVRFLIEGGTITRSDDGQGWAITASLEDIQIPDSLQGVIMDRIDRLDPETKRTLQAASVIGPDFLYKVLAHVLEDTL